MPQRLLCLLALLLLTAAPLSAQDDDDADEPLPSISEKTEGLEKSDGFVPFYWDARRGKIWIEISDFDSDLLYVSYLAAGLGSNDVGLDRGQLGGERVVRFERVGPKVLLVEPNLRYRATTSNPAEREAVREAFAPAVVHGFEVAAEDDDGTVLIDATAFVVRDAHGIARTLKETEQGTFKLDESRSTPYLPATKAFPENTELEARLTFSTDEEPGEYVRDTAADPYAVTLRVHHSFVKLPELDGDADIKSDGNADGYTPRRHDPRSGTLYSTYRDYSVPIGEPVAQRLVNRHRLTCAGPRDADGLCPVDDPIVYYLDPGTPEPVRSALLDGARWWSEAFEAAGFKDAYRVEMLPADADPMDVRYNTIQWVHRRTRGWSYGMTVTDPRTGEILKGHVTLGSLRVRQDYLLAEGLLAPYAGERSDGIPAEEDPMLEMALARIRQLSAHEVGHTIGLAHNFAASVNDRASVMDYPAPLATVDGDEVSLENAYDTGVGAWDVIAVRYAYAQPEEGQAEDALLDGILQEAQDDGLLFITDRDARPDGAAHPEANLWDNGSDVVEALEREMEVRRVAMERFGEAVVRTGEPQARMEEVLVPLYLRHRYQVEATTKAVGGVTYDYALRGDDGAAAPARVPADQQQAALDALLATLRPEALRLPDAALEALAPRPPGHPETRELFPGRSGLTLDPYAPAEVAASMVLSGLVHPERAMRLVVQHDANPDVPGLRDVLAQITKAVWPAQIPGDAVDAELQRTVQQVWTDVLLDHAAHEATGPAVRARLEAHLREVQRRLMDKRLRDPETESHREAVRAAIDRYLNRTRETDPETEALDTPPGSPIGTAPTYRVRQDWRESALQRFVPGNPCGAG